MHPWNIMLEVLLHHYCMLFKSNLLIDNEAQVLQFMIYSLLLLVYYEIFNLYSDKLLCMRSEFIIKERWENIF